MTPFTHGRSLGIWAVQLLGRFNAIVGDTKVESLPGRRTKDLLAYLLLFRDRPHHREVLAGTLWPESDTAQSRKYLRQSLWHLRALEPETTASSSHPIVKADSEWVEVDSTNLRLDVADLEAAHDQVKLIAGEDMTTCDAERLANAMPLYRGDLLEGCYEEWCIYERERLKAMYVSLLEKLLGYCEAHGEHEEGLMYGEKLLRQDRAHERAHCRLMRLRYLAGDRSGALRQFESCRDALQEELGVSPGERTTSLYDRMKADEYLESRYPQAFRAADPASRGATSLATLRNKPLPGEEPTGAIVHLQTALEALSLAERLVELSLRAVQGPAAED